MTNLLDLHHYTIYGNTHVNVYLPRNGLPRHCRQWLFFSFYRRHLLSPSPPKSYWGHRLCFGIEIAGETKMAADDKFPPLTPILLLPHAIFVSLFLSWGPCSGFGIEMAAKTETADNHFHPPTPILVLPHVVFSLIFFVFEAIPASEPDLSADPSSASSSFSSSAVVLEEAAALAGLLAPVNHRVRLEYRVKKEINRKKNFWVRFFLFFGWIVAFPLDRIFGFDRREISGFLHHWGSSRMYQRIAKKRCMKRNVKCFLGEPVSSFIVIRGVLHE